MSEPLNIPAGLCQCGCGAQTKRRTQDDRWGKNGEWREFLRGHSAIARRRVSERSRPEDRGHETPCLIWQLTLSSKGYGQEWSRAHGFMRGAHVNAYEAANGPVPDGMEVDHLCSQRDCVNPDHLEAVTHAVNVRRGKNTKLTSEMVRQIRSLVQQGWRHRDIADAYGTVRSNVSYIGRHSSPSV